MTYPIVIIKKKLETNQMAIGESYYDYPVFRLTSQGKEKTEHWKNFNGNINEIIVYINECPPNKGTRNYIEICPIDEENYSI